MTNEEKMRQDKDAVTIGQVRGRYLATLESQIGELATLIRKGYHSRTQAEKFLSESIGQTLTMLDNLDAFASQVVIFGARKDQP